MRRRDFIAGAAGAAAFPLAVRAQQKGMLTIGYLHSGSPQIFAHVTQAFRQGLNEAGFAEDRNVRIESRWAQGQFDRLPALAGELVARPVGVIFAAGGSAPAVAAKAATATIPIVFMHGADPVSLGLVDSINRPGGNVTGINLLAHALDAKRLENLRRLVPNATVIGVLINPDFDSGRQLREVEDAARTIGQQIHTAIVRRDDEIEPAFADFAQRRVGALMVGAGTFFNTRRSQIVVLAARYELPATYPLRESVIAGGLMSYGASTTDAYRQSGVYVGRILQGMKPADLPVLQAVKFELAINLKTAKTLKLDVPPELLALADEVVE